MNEKFFNLKKEKQDRMLNAAMLVFGENGYKRASTDDIVQEAGISKGLLFHYFGNKLGVYTFLLDYSVKLYSLELADVLSSDMNDYFSLVREREKAVCGILKTYPAMELFLLRAGREDHPEAAEATRESVETLKQLNEKLLAKADFSHFKKEAEPVRIKAMVEYTIQSLLTSELARGTYSPDALFSEIRKYLEMLEKLCY